MKKNFRRLLIALGISSAGFFGTILWYQLGKDDKVTLDRKPLARLEGSSNEVQRKPVKRIIWEDINKNDELYTGEAVRTAANAEAQLFFVRSGTTIHLDPDSLIVLEENDQGLSLDFLKGNLFVQKSEGGNHEELLLKTGSGQIKMKSAADLSLSRNAGGKVSLEVHRGEAELNQGNKKTELTKATSAEISGEDIHLAKDHLEVLRPSAGERVLLNMSRGQKLEIGWKALARGYRVELQVGPSRKTLAAVPEANTSGESGQTSFAAKPGRWYLRLVAHGEGLPDLTSVTVPFSVDPKTAPSLLEPIGHVSLERTSTEAPVAFRWINRDPLLAQVFEVSSESNFKKALVHQDLDGKVSETSAPLADGTYFWRVTGYLKIKGKTEGLSSSAESFQIGSHFELEAPRLVSPAPDQRLSISDVEKNGVALRWDIPKHVTRVKVRLELKNGDVWTSLDEQTREVSVLRVSDLKPGRYRWTAESLNDFEGPAKKSEPAEFSILELPKIIWIGAAPLIQFEYRLNPSLRARWQPLAESPKSYRYKVWEENEKPEAAPWHSTKDPQFEAALPHDGKFLSQVEALDSGGHLVAQSEAQLFLIKPQPLPPAPQWSEQTPNVLKGDGKGNLSMTWQQVEQAEHYLMILESPEGKVLKKTSITRTTASLTHLRPGAYQVYLKSVDGMNRESLDGVKRNIEIPKTSDIRAPKIRAMKVK